MIDTDQPQAVHKAKTRLHLGEKQRKLSGKPAYQPFYQTPQSLFLRHRGSVLRKAVSRPSPSTRFASALQRVLLISPPVHDVRFPWPEWRDTAYLYRLAASFIEDFGSDVKVMDALTNNTGGRMLKRKVGTVELDGQIISRWRYGVEREKLEAYLLGLSENDWTPDTVIIECLTTFWWEGAAEVAELVREVFPNTSLGLCGAYGAIACDHAKHAIGPDFFINDITLRPAAITNLSRSNVHIAFEGRVPQRSLITLGSPLRTPGDIADEIFHLKQAGIQHFAFSAESIADGEHFASVLEAIVARQIAPRLYAIGNLAAHTVNEVPALAALLKRSGFREICFADDRHIVGAPAVEQWIEEHRGATSRLVKAGYLARSRALTASICVGRLGEDLLERSRAVVRIASVVGSVIVWPYQPDPRELDGTPLEMQNGKLFPLRTANGFTYREYLEVLGMAAIMNSKYRDKTFDFFGAGLAARMFRESVNRRGWEPDPSVKGTQQLPARMVVLNAS